MSTTNPMSVPTTGTWSIDSVHSTASLSVKHNLVARFRATIVGVSGSLDGGVLSGSVPVDGLELGLPVFKEHLLSEGFLDGANHPNLSFSSNRIVAKGDGNVSVDGELTIKGTTRPVSASGTVTGPQEVTGVDDRVRELLGLSLSTTIDRRDFGLEIPAGTGWEVEITVDLELARS